MKNKSFIALSALLLGAVSVSSITVLASVENPEAATTGKVKFKVDDSQEPEVVDPTDPEGKNEVDPEGEGSTGDGNKSFNINWISHFKFGEVSISGKTMKIYAEPTKLNFKAPAEGVPAPVSKENLPNFLQVTDNRGTNTGWNVKATATEFIGNDTEQSKLTGAELLLTNPQLFATAANLELSPVMHDTSLNLLETPGSANLLLNAAANKGQGTWSMAWSPNKKGNDYEFKYNDTGADKGVQLVVPPTAMPKDKVAYTSTVTWVLSDTPSQ